MKRPGYLELGRRENFGRPARRPVGPVEPPPDPDAVADFDLGTWRVRPSLARMTRADRIVALEKPTLLALLILAERPPDGVNRDVLAARVYGGGTAEDHEPKLRRVLGFLRRVFSEDGAVRILNVPGDAFVLEIGAPVPGRGLKGSDSEALREDPGAIAAWLGRSRRRWLSLGLASLVVTILAGSLIVLIERSHVVLFGTVSSSVPFATEPGEKTSPSFSPDGRQVVYSWRLADGSGTHLVVRPLGGGSWRPLTAGDGIDRFPAWSPRGNLIAFERLTPAGCGVLLIAPDGSNERHVGDCSFGAEGPLTWTREGDAIIYARRPDTERSRQLVSLAVATGALTGVSNPVIGMPGDEQPVLAPNGRRLVFLREHAIGVGDLVLLDLGTVAVEKVTHDHAITAGTAFEAGSHSVVFASPRGGRLALWRTSLERWQPDLMIPSPFDQRGPAISNDGRSMAFEEWHYATRLARVPASGAATTVRDGGEARLRQPQLSPDGTQLVYVSNQGGHEQLWLAPVAGGTPRALTTVDLDYPETPRFSPDGRTVAFSAAHRGRFDLWAVSLADGALRRLSDDGQSRAPSFSHDGRWLYFGSQRSGRWQIWRETWPDGGNAEQLTTDGGLAALEARDGDSLYYVRADRMGLWHRSREPGGDETLAAGTLSPADWCNWDVTATDIWFVARPDLGAPHLARYSIDAERVTELGPLEALLPDSGLAASADGNGVLLATVTRARADLKLATLE
jgi:Tol biopolymer transport system component